MVGDGQLVVDVSAEQRCVDLLVGHLKLFAHLLHGVRVDDRRILPQCGGGERDKGKEERAKVPWVVYCRSIYVNFVEVGLNWTDLYCSTSFISQNQYTKPEVTYDNLFSRRCLFASFSLFPYF